eukprot:447811-Rhodomonas_salina.1
MELGWHIVSLTESFSSEHKYWNISLVTRNTLWKCTSLQLWIIWRNPVSDPALVLSAPGHGEARLEMWTMRICSSVTSCANTARPACRRTEL